MALEDREEGGMERPGLERELLLGAHWRILSLNEISQAQRLRIRIHGSWAPGLGSEQEHEMARGP